MPRRSTWLTKRDSGGIDTFANTSWLAIPGLVRSAMELEFGEEAAVYVTGSPC